MLSELARRYGEHTAVVDARGPVGYAALARRSERVAAGLAARGLRPGDIAVVQARNDADYVVLLFAAFRLGVIPVCALPAHREREIGYFLDHTGAAAYLHPGEDDHRRIAASTAREVRLVTTVAEAAASSGPVDALPPPPGGGDLALLQLSGGSTGVPKLIPRTHDDYLYSVRVAAEVCEIDDRTVYLCALPAAHNFPLSSPGILGVLSVGGTVVMAPDPSPDTCFDLMDDAGVTMTAVVPALAQAWLTAARTRGRRPGSLRVLQVGGARLDAAHAAQVAPVLGCRVQQVFGMAEGLVCYTRLDAPDAVAHHTQGRPASPYDEIRIVDDRDRDVPDGHSGHLLARGPYTVRGYFRAAAHNPVAFTPDGYYRTGDLVRRTETGDLVVTGRAKDQINRGGEKIAAPEVEELLRGHPDIHDAAVIAVPDPVLGERSCAVCVAAPDRDPTGKQIRRHLRELGVAAYKIPDLVRFVPHLPRTAVGKIDKKRLKEDLSR
ncbi:(2,3-dihydroxybenzoyl)adenylate synthase [Stackebrandtia albiflava]